MIAGYTPREMSHIRPARPAPSPAASARGAAGWTNAGRMPDKCRTGVGGPSGVGELTHLVGLDDLLVLAAFLGTLGALEGVDLLPAGEVDRANAALGQQSVDGFGVAVGCHTATFSGLGQILEHVGHDGERIGLGGADQAHRAALGPTGGVQAVAHFAAVGLGGDAAGAVGVGQVSAVLVVGDAGASAGL